MITVYKYSLEVSTMEGKELFKFKGNVVARANGYKLTINKFRLDIKRKLVTIRGVRITFQQEYWGVEGGI